MTSKRNYSSFMFHNNLDMIETIKTKLDISSRNESTDDLFTANMRLMMDVLKSTTDMDPKYIFTLSDIKKGVYSPHQLALYLASEIADNMKPSYDYPFMFSVMGYYTYALVAMKANKKYNHSMDDELQYQENPNGDIDLDNVDLDFEPNIDLDLDPDDIDLYYSSTQQAPEKFALQVANASDQYTQFIQAMFYIRELREEGEHLSFELVLPQIDSKRLRLGIKQLAQIFGRGIAFSQCLDCDLEPSGSVTHVFNKHDNTPQSVIYNLKNQFSHIEEHQASLVLKRDGLITIAESENPLLEYYNGKWNVVDLKSASHALGCLLSDKFDTKEDEMPSMTQWENISEKVMNLAYHLASHWHGAIIAILGNDVKFNEVFTEPSKDHEHMETMINNQIGDLRKLNEKLPVINGESPEKIPDLCLEGIGRLLLSLSIQDGAIVFDQDGNFKSCSRFVNSSEATKIEGGARKKASKVLSKKGIVISISHDGGIVIFYTKNENEPENCIELRVR